MSAGRRVPDGTEPFPGYEPGDYGRYAERWFVRPPGCSELYGDVSGHEVVEHEDGTITVSPSILIKGHEATWHGYLERGQWREV